MLGRLFNQMTKQLKGQRTALLENTEAIEERRRLFDSVLSSVTSGVIGLDGKGHVAFVNRSATRLLDDEDAYASMSRAHNPYGDGKAAGRIHARLMEDLTA